MPIVVPGAPITGTESLVLDGLNITDGLDYGLIEYQLPIPRKRLEWTEGADADGALLTRDPLVGNGQLIVKLAVLGNSRDDTHALIGAIVDKLEEADRNTTGIPCVWTPYGGAAAITFYVLTGEIPELALSQEWLLGHSPEITVVMDCRPGGYGARTLYATATVSGPQTTVVVPDFPGDMPSDEAELIITDMSTQSRRWVEWGAEYRHYDAAAPSTLILDSDSLVTSGFAGTQATLSGSYDPNASGNNAITASVVGAWQALCGTGSQVHIGKFRIKAHVNSGPGGCDTLWRFAWRAGDGSYTTNDPYTLTTSVQAFYEIDLGTIDIPTASAGTQTWDGRLEAYGNAGTDTLYADYIRLVPAGEGYGRARAAYVAQPGVIVGRDDFTGTTSGNALNARVAPAGGTWATSGAATDFLFTDSPGEMISRASLSDTGNGRFAILGSTNYTDMEIEAEVARGAPFVTSGTQGYGVIARWVDSSNYLLLRYHSYPPSRDLTLTQVVAGVSTMIATLATGFADSALVFLKLKLSVVGANATGYLMGLDGTVYKTVTGSSTDLATGGALDDGKPGLNSINTAGSTVTHYFDDILISQLPAEPIALYSGRTLEVRSATTERQSSDGTKYGRPNSYRGGRFVLNPAGTEDRSTRVAVSAYRNDVDASGTAEHISDSLKLEVYARPRYSVIPH